MSAIKKQGGDLLYVVGSAGKTGNSPTFAIVDNISARNMTTEDLVMVRDATADPTVHRGWALYLSVEMPTSNSDKIWVKIAEEESVDGLWGVKAELLQVVATKAELLAAISGVTAQLTLDYFKANGRFDFSADVYIAGNLKSTNFTKLDKIPVNDSSWTEAKTEAKVNEIITAINTFIR